MHGKRHHDVKAVVHLKTKKIHLVYDRIGKVARSTRISYESTAYLCSAHMAYSRLQELCGATEPNQLPTSTLKILAHLQIASAHTQSSKVSFMGGVRR